MPHNLKKPKGKIDVSALMLRNKDDEDKTFFEDRFTTDSLGRFRFVADIDGDWKMVFAASKNMKKQNLTISLLNRLSPKPRAYAPFELKISTIEPAHTTSEDMGGPQSDIDSEDPVTGLDNDKAIMLKNIEVKGKKSSKEYDIYRARSASVASYDFEENYDRLVDEGFYYCNDVNAFLCNVNENFHLHTEDSFNYLTYKHRIPLVVVDYEVTYLPDEFKYNDLQVEWVKAVYISEDFNLISQYADPAIPRMELAKHHRCVVFIETYPEESRPVAPGTGVRRTTFHGYDIPTEFYHPDYSTYLPDEDHRRTLYWNPMLTPDDNGFVQIQFFNNGTYSHPIVDAQAVTAGGLIGISRQKGALR